LIIHLLVGKYGAVDRVPVHPARSLKAVNWLQYTA
jgi:hypothetical protein